MSKCEECTEEYMPRIYPCNNCINDPLLTDHFEPVIEQSIPFLAVGNGELTEPVIGDYADCPHCNKKHKLNYAKDVATGKESKLLQFYNCDKTGKTYLYSLEGKKLK